MVGSNHVLNKYNKKPNSYLQHAHGCSEAGSSVSQTERVRKSGRKRRRACVDKNQLIFFPADRAAVTSRPTELSIKLLRVEMDCCAGRQQKGNQQRINNPLFCSLTVQVC
ncbi:hypothetical protein ATANTOWER_003018 [Ataeniobius toweri]|uniref:Uncharacterized protein n=1 Tax=Ataeniobius toweri TaxID=208326 RepID=A0ABU7B701_9TELE|nr:hypothetical protein [Ataeniobius toweri]